MWSAGFDLIRYDQAMGVGRSLQEAISSGSLFAEMTVPLLFSRERLVFVLAGIPTAIHHSKCAPKRRSFTHEIAAG